MKRLGLLDDAFLRLETRSTPLHVGVLMLLQPPGRRGRHFTEKLAERLRQSTWAAAPFNLRLVQRRGIHYWEEDEHFDLDNHFAHTSLPRPGRIRELLAMVSRVHSAHLDREYPLWRMYLIEGLEDGRVAVYMKIHHALVDGVAGMRLLLKSMSTNAQRSKKLPPPWEVQTQKSGAQQLPVPTPAADSVPALYKLALEGWSSIFPLARELVSTYQDAREHNPNLALVGHAPYTPFNDKVSATRRFAGQSYAMPRIRTVADAYEATVNDVVLAMCAGALRRYLADVDKLPAKTLVAAVPISLRKPGSETGNEVAFTLTTLATDVADPVARLRAIKEGMDYNKARLRRLTPGQVMAYTAAITLPTQLLSMLHSSKDSALATVVISHVPGPRTAMYWQGMKLNGMYPASLNINGAALNITLVSRHDFVDFGLIACRKSVPSMQRLLDYLEDSLAELEKSIAPRAGSRTGQAKGKAKAKATTKAKAKAEAKAKATTKAKAKAKATTKAKAKAKATTKAKAKAEAKARPKAKPRPKPRPKPKPKPGAFSSGRARVQPKLKAQSASTSTGANAETGPGADKRKTPGATPKAAVRV